MATKKIGNGLSDKVIDKSLDKVLDFIREMKEDALDEKEDKDTKKEAEFNELKEMVKKEFIRVCDKLEKTEPETEKYYSLTRNLYQLKSIITGWY